MCICVLWLLDLMSDKLAAHVRGVLLLVVFVCVCVFVCFYMRLYVSVFSQSFLFFSCEDRCFFRWFSGVCAYEVVHGGVSFLIFGQAALRGRWPA